LMREGDRIRDDVRVPVIVLQSETDVILLGSGTAEQPDGENLREWEVAGSAHADTYTLVAALQDGGTLSPQQLAETLAPTTKLIAGNTEVPINSGPQHRYVGNAALHHLIGWIGGGSAPAHAPRLAIDESHSHLLLADDGNVIGGIRTPWVDVPTST